MASQRTDYTFDHVALLEESVRSSLSYTPVVRFNNVLTKYHLDASALYPQHLSRTKPKTNFCPKIPKIGSMMLRSHYSEGGLRTLIDAAFGSAAAATGCAAVPLASPQSGHQSYQWCSHSYARAREQEYIALLGPGPKDAIFVKFRETFHLFFFWLRSRGIQLQLFKIWIQTL